MICVMDVWGDSAVELSASRRRYWFFGEIAVTLQDLTAVVKVRARHIKGVTCAAVAGIRVLLAMPNWLGRVLQHPGGRSFKTGQMALLFCNRLGRSQCRFSREDVLDGSTQAWCGGIKNRDAAAGGFD